MKEESEAEQVKLAEHVGKIVATLNVAKKAGPAKGGFRSFMQTAKTELQQMQMAGTDLGGAAAAGSGGFAMSVALPQGKPLVDMNATAVTGAASANEPEASNAPPGNQ